MPTIDQPASYSSRGRGSHTVPPVTTIASLTVNIVLPVSASSPMEDLPLELPIAMNVTCPQDLISPIIAGITYSILQKNPNGDFFVLSHLSMYRETVFGFFT
jgi:hypothetical protein